MGFFTQRNAATVALITGLAGLGTAAVASSDSSPLPRAEPVTTTATAGTEAAGAPNANADSGAGAPDQNVTTAPSDPSSAPETGKAPAGPPMVSTVPTEVSSHYGIFRRARTSRDSFPESTSFSGPTMAGENPNLSRLAATTPGGYRYYLAPGEKSLCVFAENGSGGCGRQTGESSSDLTVTLCAPDLQANNLRLIAIFPDGVDRVLVVLRDNSTTSFNVSNNAFVADFSSAQHGRVPTELRWQDGSGSYVDSVPVPPTAGSVKCG